MNSAALSVSINPAGEISESTGDAHQMDLQKRLAGVASLV
jgi:hypothetical protein